MTASAPGSELAPAPDRKPDGARSCRTPVVCQLVHSLNVGGAELLSLAIARKLTGRCRSVFVCLDELGVLGAAVRDEGFSVAVAGRRGGFDRRCAARLREIFTNLRVDLVHAHQYTPFFYAAAAGFLRRRPAILFTEHGRFYPDTRSRRRVLFNRLMFRRHDRVVGVGEAVRRALVANEGFSPARVGVIYNGIDLSRFQSSAEDRVRMRRTLGLSEQDFVVIQVARLDALKDHATALRTMERLATRIPSARLLIVGDGPLRAEIDNEINTRSLRPHVQLLGTRGDVAQLLAAADVAMLTSISEGIPLTLIEAMAARLPIVATRVGGVPEVVVDGVTGWLAPSGDDAALADAVAQLATDADQRCEFGENGRRRAELQFSDTEMCGAYANMYEDMLRR